MSIESACLIAKYTQEDPFNGLAPSDRMAWQAPDLELYHPWNLDAKKSIDIAMECEQIALEQPEIDNSDGAELSSFEGESIYANSNGLIAKLRNTKHTLFCSLIAKRNDEMQTAYEYGIALDANDLTSATQVGLGGSEISPREARFSSLKSTKMPNYFYSKTIFWFIFSITWRS